MNAYTVIVGIIGITIGLYVVADVLLKSIKDVTAEGQPGAEYSALIGLVGLLAIFVLVMWAVRMMGSSKN